MSAEAFLPPSLLLVDDEQDFVAAMAKRLAKRGLEIQTAFSGQEALDKLDGGSSSKTDVVILDVKMPGMDGLEALAKIKAKHPLIEVIMLTGHATVENAIEGMKGGAYDYLMKPCEMEVLLSKVQEAVTRKRNQEAKILEAKVQAYALQRGLD